MLQRHETLAYKNGEFTAKQIWIEKWCSNIGSCEFVICTASRVCELLDSIFDLQLFVYSLVVKRKGAVEICSKSDWRLRGRCIQCLDTAGCTFFHKPGDVIVWKDYGVKHTQKRCIWCLEGYPRVMMPNGTEYLPQPLKVRKVLSNHYRILLSHKKADTKDLIASKIKRRFCFEK